MDEILNGKSIKADFEAQVTATLMIQSNALNPLKLAARLCGIPKQEILRRIDCGTFPKPRTLSLTGKRIREAFYLKDLHEWIKCPHLYHQRGLHKRSIKLVANKKGLPPSCKNCSAIWRQIFTDIRAIGNKCY